MKYLFLFIYIFYINAALSQSSKDSGVIYYGHKIGAIAIDTANIDNDRVKNIITKQFLQKKKALSQDRDVYKLLFKDQKSMFLPVKKMQSDANRTSFKFIPDDKFFIDKSKGLSLRRTNFSGNYYNIKDNETLTWEITSENKLINDILCTKAITTIKNSHGVKTLVTAWFSKEIPLNFGPLGYYGLPGLIVQLQLRDDIYYLRKIKYTDVEINQFVSGINISNEKFQRKIKRHIKKF